MTSAPPNASRRDGEGAGKESSLSGASPRRIEE
jgi:hypothetical protein